MSTRRKEWVLDIEFTKRETIADSCEAYARIVARAKGSAERRRLAVEYQAKASLSGCSFVPSRRRTVEIAAPAIAFDVPVSAP